MEPVRESASVWGTETASDWGSVRGRVMELVTERRLSVQRASIVLL
jgi:hypothetical protein